MHNAGPLVAPPSLSDARVQAHWAAQVLSATADALLPREADDGQSNLGWEGTTRALVGRRLGKDDRLALVVPTLTLQWRGKDDVVIAEHRLAGHTLADALQWASRQLMERRGVEITPVARDYAMPAHPVAPKYRDERGSGAAFTAEGEGLEALSAWIDAAFATLSAVSEGNPGASEVRLWPHHFDVGTLIPLPPPDDEEGQASSIGAGWSLGDGGHPLPYGYVSPWPRPAREPVWPTLAQPARWQLAGWHGAQLEAKHIVARATKGGHTAQVALMGHYLGDAVAASRALLDRPKPEEF